MIPSAAPKGWLATTMLPEVRGIPRQIQLVGVPPDAQLVETAVDECIERGSLLCASVPLAQLGETRRALEKQLR